MQQTLPENQGLPCVSGTRQRLENARQSLCRAFVIEAHDKGHTADYYTVKSHCRAPSLTTHVEKSLSCVTSGARRHECGRGWLGRPGEKKVKRGVVVKKIEREEHLRVQNRCRARPMTLARGKEYRLPCVLIKRARQITLHFILFICS
jgi:hypothetical protein